MTVRFWEIDAVRGIAIVMMVLYHLIFNLDYFGGYAVDSSGSFWRPFATVTASLFLLVVGISLKVSHERARERSPGDAGLLWKNSWRGIRVLGYGMLITLVVWAVAPGGQIYFGILHVIGLSVLFAWPFLKRPLLALPASLGILLVAPIIDNLRIDQPWLLWLGVRAPVGYMFDYRPMIPWFGVVLLGILAAHLLYRDGSRRFPWPHELPALMGQPLATLGRYSLAIYLLHQPVLLTILFALGVITLDFS